MNQAFIYNALSALFGRDCRPSAMRATYVRSIIHLHAVLKRNPNFGGDAVTDVLFDYPNLVSYYKHKMHHLSSRLNDLRASTPETATKHYVKGPLMAECNPRSPAPLQAAKRERNDFC